MNHDKEYAYWTTNVSGHNGNQASSYQASALVSQLRSEQIGYDDSQRREKRRQEDANISDVDSDVGEVKYVVEERRCDHKAGINGATDDSA